MRSPKLLFLILLMLAGNILFPQSHKKAKAKYDGINLMDALKLTTKSDILAFLDFVLASPEEYM